MMQFKFSSILVNLSLFILAACSDTQPTNFIGMSYHNVRPFILKAGWNPSMDFRDGTYGYDEELGNYHAYPFEEYGYSEIGVCTGMGTRLCDFYFENENKDRYLRIITDGEDFGLNSNMPEVIYIGITTAEKEAAKIKDGKSYWGEVLGEEGRKNFEAIKKILEETIINKTD